VTEILLPFVDEAIGIEAALDITTRGGIKEMGVGYLKSLILL
jgi:hypothetical protein